MARIIWNVAAEYPSKQIPGVSLSPVQTVTHFDTTAALADVQIVIAAGAPGVELLAAEARQQAASLKVAIDLNAVPPLGIGGVDVMDKAKERGGVVCYGAIGVGGTKMKIHKAAIRKLYERNDLVLDAEQIFAIGRDLS